MNPPVALVFGGTGAVGSAVLHGLARANVPTTFTWHRSREKAQALAAELTHRPLQLDLTRPDAIRAALRGLRAEGVAPNLFIHCAGVNRAAPLTELTDEEWRDAHEVNCHCAFVAMQELSPGMAAQKEGHAVLVGALDRSQSAPMPAHFAAAQGALSALVMALGKELGPRGICVNMVSLGLLEGGLSREVNPKLAADYKAFSAMRRLGRPDEVAKAILWLALGNTYINGRVLPVNGGI
jgi:3-oxoacyl-[acyl-carrier protein] reductase